MRPALYFLFMSLMFAGLTYCGQAEAGDHRLYLGLNWTHLSNVDAGIPFNTDPEDNADHVGIDVEYQYHMTDGDYLFLSLGVGKSRFNGADGRSGWDCSGCKLPSLLRLGYKWRMF